MTVLAEVLRYVNAALALLVGLHLVVTTSRTSWTVGRPQVRLLRIGTGLVVLTTSYASITGILDHRPPSLTTAFLFVGLAWATVGTVWTITDERTERKRR